MFLFCFALVILINLGINGQNTDFNKVPSNGVEQTSFFGRLHQLIDNQNQDQPTSISCYRIRPNIKNAHPIDNTKYFICRNEQRYEILTCPNGGIFDDQEKACIDLCEQKKPCLNQGQCIILSNLTLQCVCRRDWTGERCEIPLSSCANNPCGPNAECRMLVASDYPQDYVCICDKEKTYGRNCQQTVPNPCLANTQQFHPFAFSRQAYINCDDERIFFQPCNARLYWNQEEKRCDRTLPLLLRTSFLNIRNRNGQTQTNVVQPTQWQGWNQVSDGNQRFPSQFQTWQESQTNQNQPSLPNRFVDTTTVAPQVFHLQGFAPINPDQQNTQWQNNRNNQFQSSGNLQSQSWQDQTTTEITPQLPAPNQRNNQLGFVQQQQQQQSWQNNQVFQNQNGQSFDSQPGLNNQNFPVQTADQRASSSFETTTIANNDVQQGLSMNSLRAWQPDQRGSSNQNDQSETLNSIPSFQLKSWKV